MDHVGLCVIRKTWLDLRAILGKGFFQHGQDGWFRARGARHGSFSYGRVIAEDGCSWTRSSISRRRPEGQCEIQASRGIAVRVGSLLAGAWRRTASMPCESQG